MAWAPEDGQPSSHPYFLEVTPETLQLADARTSQAGDSSFPQLSNFPPLRVQKTSENTFLLVGILRYPCIRRRWISMTYVIKMICFRRRSLGKICDYHRRNSFAQHVDDFWNLVNIGSSEWSWMVYLVKWWSCKGATAKCLCGLAQKPIIGAKSKCLDSGLQ